MKKEANLPSLANSLVSQFGVEGPHMQSSSATIPPLVPIKYSGQWIAWDFNRTRIIASGTTRRKARDLAKSKGEERPVLAKVPTANEVFIGGGRST